ncbi:hypothetical protein EGW08_021939 [Elysia chlorotica]|uniref:Uncharacterized protein n=1 Tax=Elysia chlorotica TaxID=188477 RepID=A0A433SMD8_ELYCH|nr:hypothetical protein EGW08_021939 [Elysia chlorotica]
MSKCQAKDEMFLPAGIPQFKPEYNFPTRFENFHWWGETKVQPDVCYKTIKRDELPIPPLHDERWRYPYRYSSCQPAMRTIRWKKSLREAEEAGKTGRPLKRMPMLPRDIRQAKGYETTTMDTTLEPFLYHPPTTIITREIPDTLLTPTWAPRCARTEFGEYILRSLHPNYKRDPRIRKRLQFCSKDTDREVCVALNELESQKPKPWKKARAGACHTEAGCQT